MDIKDRFSSVRTNISETHDGILNLIYLLDESVNIVDDDLFDKLNVNLTRALHNIENAWDNVKVAEKEFDGKVVDE